MCGFANVQMCGHANVQMCECSMPKEARSSKISYNILLHQLYLHFKTDRDSFTA
jgi:hypothetical protein